MLTPGYYVFCPPGTPCCPTPTYLGSRDWTNDERDPWPALGEAEGNRGYYSGGLAVAYPPTRLIGSAECLARGERFPLAVVPQLVGGFDSRCYAAPPPAFPVFITDIDILGRPVATTFASVLDLMGSNPVAAEAILQAYLGPTATIQNIPNDTGPFPGTLVAVTPNYNVVVITGTSNYQQLALQVMFTGGGPTDFGQFSTNALWFAAATVVNNRILAAGGDPDKPTIFVGHSYGGAVASVLTARWIQFNPGRDVRLLTYGMPRPGDSRLVDLLKPLTQRHFANVSDPVPGTAPGVGELLGVPVAVPLPFLDRWNQMKPPPGQVQLAQDGTITDTQASTLGIADATVIATQVILGLPVPPFAAHEAKEYFLRLLAVP